MSTSSASTNPFYDAFISYGRADSQHFATRLCQRLAAQNCSVWFDQHDIPLGVDFLTQIETGLAKSHNFLFIITPHAMNSSYCVQEINLALKHHKRIIPLLHMEQISRETWLARHPQGSDAEWADYQAQGLNSIFPKMHEGIGKINWVYCREGIDDFEASLQAIVTILQRHQDYVGQHTVLLAQALEWEKQQKQTRYLLVGEERQAAERWLKHRFVTEQAPCEPTPLHCEFICESIKNANNLMTQVFLSRAEADCVITVPIRSDLIREGITVWTSQTDIKTGEAFESAIERGIEQADTFVYCLSLNALQSQYCQRELDYALSLNKRVIPLLIQLIDLEQIPPQLRSLQFINFTGQATAADDQQGIDQLLKVLLDNMAYYEEHKLLLSKALKWERQGRNPSILLRGYNLRHAEVWLRGAQHRDQHLPTPLQTDFITESLHQPPAASLDVFLSYSRVDSELARRLNDELQLRGKTTWFDQESIASGADFQQEIYRGIESADNFLFILSPRSVSSPYCVDEVEHAAKLNKRFISLLHRSVDTTKLHPELAKVQWLDFHQQEGDFYANFNRLVRTLETDREHVRSHTKWSQRTLEWEELNHNDDLLMRGSEFVIAEAWLKEAERNQKRPLPTDLQKAFIQASSNAINARSRKERRRVVLLRSLLALVSSAFVGAVGIGMYAFQQKGLAELALEDQAKTLAQQSLSLTASEANREFDGLILAIRADKLLKRQHLEPKVETRNQLIQALQESLYRVKERNRLKGHTKDVAGISASPDGQIIATASWDKTAKLWSQNGLLLRTLEHGDTIWEVNFSPDSQIIATRSRDKTVKLWNRKGESLKTLNHHDEVWGTSFSPDSQIIATRSRDKTVKLWNRKGESLKTLTFNEDIWEARFSPNGQWLVTLTKDGTVQLWTSQGEKQKTIKQKEILAVLFSPNSQTIATRSKQSIDFWNLNGKKLKTLNESDQLSQFSFSPDGQTIALVASKDKRVSLCKHSSQKCFPLKQSDVNKIQFNPNGPTLLTASADHTVKLWGTNGEELQTFQLDDEVRDAIFIPHTSLVMTLSGKGGIKILDLENPYSKPLTGHKKLVRRAHFSPNGQMIVTRSEDATAKLWKLPSGELLKTLTGHTRPIRAVSFSPDSTKVATVGEDEQLKLWNLEGNELFSQNLHHKIETSLLSFSPDGQKIVVSLSDNNYSEVQIWSLEGKKVSALIGNQWSPIFNPKYPIFATSSRNTAYLWTQEGKKIVEINGHKDVLLDISFSPDGNMVATASADKTVKLWTLKGQEIAMLRHYDRVNRVKFSSDGQIIATASEDKIARLWNLKGQELQTLLGHRDRVFIVLLSSDGKTVVTASNDKTIKLWNLEGKLLRTLEQNHEIYGMDLSPNSKQLVVATDQNSAVLWSLDSANLQVDQQVVLDSLLGRACTWVNNYLKNKPVEDSDHHLCDGIHETPASQADLKAVVDTESAEKLAFQSN